jgi:hypothetical protein
MGAHGSAPQPSHWLRLCVSAGLWGGNSAESDCFRYAGDFRTTFDNLRSFHWEVIREALYGRDVANTRLGPDEWWNAGLHVSDTRTSAMPLASRALLTYAG